MHPDRFTMGGKGAASQIGIGDIAKEDQFIMQLKAYGLGGLG